MAGRCPVVCVSLRWLHASCAVASAALRPAAGRSGNGLRNLAARLEAAGGHQTAVREEGTFSLSVELPLVESQPLV